jgi:hypothetical protein
MRCMYRIDSCMPIPGLQHRGCEDEYREAEDLMAARSIDRSNYDHSDHTTLLIDQIKAMRGCAGAGAAVWQPGGECDTTLHKGST